MSHFFLMCLVRPEEGDSPADQLDEETHDRIDDVVNELLAPYCEELEADPYQRECWCLGRTARREARDTAAKVTGKTIDDLRGKLRSEKQEKFGTNDYRELVKEMSKEERDEYIGTVLAWEDKRWSELLAPLEAEEEKAYRAHPLYDKPNQECDECKGTGTYESTYNPKSKWDWWSYGGRWDGAIQKKEVESEDNGFNFADHHRNMGGNITMVKTILERWEDKDAPFAMLVPDGRWAERGEMGWWAAVSNEKDGNGWTNEVKAILADYQDCYAVGLDCHI